MSKYVTILLSDTAHDIVREHARRNKVSIANMARIIINEAIIDEVIARYKGATLPNLAPTQRTGRG